MNDPYSPQHTETKISYYGWVIVGMAFSANMVGFGLVYAYGVFFKPLAAEFGWSRSVTAGAFSTYAIVHNVLAFFCGRLVDKFGPKPLVAGSAFFLGIAMILMSYVDSIWQLYLFYGFFFSLGIAGLYTPMMATVSRWFEEKRGIAIGLAAAGLGAGSLVFSPLSAWLISSFGWRFSYVILGVVTWLAFIPIVKFIKKPLQKKVEDGSGIKSVEGFSFSEALKTVTLWAYCSTWMFAAVALWSLLVHIVPLITDKGISIVEAGMLAGLIGIGSLVGRIVSGFISDKVGGKKVLISAITLQSVAIVWLLLSKEIWMLYLFVVFFGLGSGGWTGVIAAFPANYFGLKATGTILGFAIIVCGVGVALGPYLGGYIFDTTQSYDYMIVMCILASVISIISAFFIRPVKKKQDEQVLTSGSM